MNAFISCQSRYLPIPIKIVGDWIRHRRIELGLSCSMAAEASGIVHWKDLEMGLVPTGNENLIRSIATTLQLKYDDVAGAIAPLEEHFESILD